LQPPRSEEEDEEEEVEDNPNGSSWTEKKEEEKYKAKQTRACGKGIKFDFFFSGCQTPKNKELTNHKKETIH
jgi:hypothetical protein